MALVQTYIFDQDKFIIMPGIFYLLLCLRIGIIHEMVGWDENDVLIKALPRVTWCSIVFNAICDYVLMDKEGIHQITVGHKILQLEERYLMSIKITEWEYLNSGDSYLILWAVRMEWIFNTTPCDWFNIQQ